MVTTTGFGLLLLFGGSVSAATLPAPSTGLSVPGIVLVDDDDDDDRWRPAYRSRERVREWGEIRRSERSRRERLRDRDDDDDDDD